MEPTAAVNPPHVFQTRIDVNHRLWGIVPSTLHPHISASEFETQAYEVNGSGVRWSTLEELPPTEQWITLNIL